MVAVVGLVSEDIVELWLYRYGLRMVSAFWLLDLLRSAWMILPLNRLRRSHRCTPCSFCCTTGWVALRLSQPVRQEFSVYLCNLFFLIKRIDILVGLFAKSFYIAFCYEDLHNLVCDNLWLLRESILAHMVRIELGVRFLLFINFLYLRYHRFRATNDFARSFYELWRNSYIKCSIKKSGLMLVIYLIFLFLLPCELSC